jgi:hypothetical protein
MASDHIIFAGVDISSGRKPVTFTALDPDLNIVALVNWSIADAIASLKEYSQVWVAVNSPDRKAMAAHSTDFKNKLVHAGYKFMSHDGPYRWMETDSQKCFQALCDKDLLPRRTLEGRIQRELILYEEGLQIHDPMEFFEEITRHKLMQGILPIENLHSSKELDALVAAYIAWRAVQRASLVNLGGNFILPVKE